MEEGGKSGEPFIFRTHNERKLFKRGILGNSGIRLNAYVLPTANRTGSRRKHDSCRRHNQAEKGKDAIILAHNCQRPEVQEIDDYAQDSVELSKKAIGERRAKIMVFSAVYFMAESVAIGKRAS